MRIGLATKGLLKLRPLIEKSLGGKAVLLSRSLWRVDVVAGWGHKPTAQRARQYARKNAIPYVAFEEGLLGHPEGEVSALPYTFVMDRTGIYYDTTSSNDFKMLVSRQGDSASDKALVEDLINHLRRNRLSKFNRAKINEIEDLKLDSSAREDRVLVVDQTAGDASIVGAGATAATFAKMLVCAVEDNPDREIVIKIHPKTGSGEKPGHFSASQLEKICFENPSVKQGWETGNIKLISESVNPWCLLEACKQVYCVSSQMGFEGLMADCRVRAFGKSFYSGYGLTEDRFVGRQTKPRLASIERLVAAFYFNYMNFSNEGPDQPLADNLRDLFRR